MEKLLLVVPGLFVVMGVGTLVWLVRERAWWRGFCTRAVTLDGVVTGMRRRRASGSGPGSFVHVPQVAYTMPDGSRLESWLRYPVGRPLAVGTALPVQADPHHPQRVVLAGDRGAPRIAPAVLGVVFVLVGLAGLAVFSAVLP